MPSPWCSLSPGDRLSNTIHVHNASTFLPPPPPILPPPPFNAMYTVSLKMNNNSKAEQICSIIWLVFSFYFSNRKCTFSVLSYAQVLNENARICLLGLANVGPLVEKKLSLRIVNRRDCTKVNKYYHCLLLCLLIFM
jgi:hypothetical protein